MNFKNIITITILFFFFTNVTGGLFSAGLAYAAYKNQKAGKEKLEHMIKEQTAEIELKHCMGVMPNDNTKAAENKLTHSMGVMPNDNTAGQVKIEHVMEEASQPKVESAIKVHHMNDKTSSPRLLKMLDWKMKKLSQLKVKNAKKLENMIEELSLISDDPNIQMKNDAYIRHHNQKNQFEAGNQF